MNLTDLIRRFRALSNDRAQPFFWSNADLVDWLNDAIEQACIRGRLLREDALADVTRIELVPLTHTYALHESLYEIIDLRVVPGAGGCTRPLRLVSREWLDAERPGWRDEQRPACWAIQDDISLRVVGTIEAGDVLALEGYRLPLELLKVDAMDGEPEIHRAHHEHLIQWALHKAFSIPDSEFFDPQRSALSERAFTAYFGPMPDSNLRRITREDVVHHNVAVLP